MEKIIDFMNNVLWNYVIVYGMIEVGILFKIRMKFVKLVNFNEILRVVFEEGRSDEEGIYKFKDIKIRIE